MSTLVIGCGNRKLLGPHPAKDMYIGGLFRFTKETAIRDGRPWLILSNHYGLLHPETVIEPYDSFATSKADIRRLARLLSYNGLNPGPVESWCPAAYTDAMILAGIAVVADPLRGLRIGKRFAWLKNAKESSHERPPA